MKKKFFIFTISLVILSGCISRQKKEQTLSLSGAFALYPMAILWADEYSKAHPDIRFNISAGGAGKGMTDALSGTVDLGMFSREILPEELDRGVWWVGLCKDAVLPTISVTNPSLEKLKQRGITHDELVAVFMERSITGWDQLLSVIPGNGFQETEAAGEVSPSADRLSEIRLYTRSDACGAAGTWAAYLGGVQEDLAGIGIHGDPGLADAVGNDPGGLGFNNTAYVYDVHTGRKYPEIEVFPLDLNENGRIDPEEDFYETLDQILKAIEDNRYPSPPARELYFVADGKPEKQAVHDFLVWVLTDGQQFVKKAGYVPLSKEQIKHYIEKLQK